MACGRGAAARSSRSLMARPRPSIGDRGRRRLPGRPWRRASVSSQRRPSKRRAAASVRSAVALSWKERQAAGWGWGRRRGGRRRRRWWRGGGGGASGRSGRPGGRGSGECGWCSAWPGVRPRPMGPLSGPRAARMASSVMPPGRRMKGVHRRRGPGRCFRGRHSQGPAVEDGGDAAVESPSRTWAGVVGETWPERLAEGAAMGPSTAWRSAWTVGTSEGRGWPACRGRRRRGGRWGR